MKNIHFVLAGNDLYDFYNEIQETLDDNTLKSILIGEIILNYLIYIYKLIYI